MIIDLYSLTSAIISQILNPITELVILTVIPSKELKTELKYNQNLQKVGQKTVQFNLELYKSSCASYSSIHFALFLQQNNFLFYIPFSNFSAHGFFSHIFNGIM